MAALLVAEQLKAAIPAAAQPLIDTYADLLRHELPGFAAGVFVHGSVALGAFDERSSDVDVVTVVSRRCTADDCAKLAAIHDRLKAAYPRPPLEVSYLQAADLGKPESAITPHPCYHDGVLSAEAHHDENAITWWLLKQQGIAVFGSLPDFPTDWDGLIAEMRQNLNRYWARFTREPGRMAWLLNDFGVQWAVLGVLRQYYSFVEGDITSKDGAGRYGLSHLPPRWHRLIQEALNIRQPNFATAYRSKLGRAYDAYQFLRYVIQTSNGLFKK